MDRDHEFRQYLARAVGDFVIPLVMAFLMFTVIIYTVHIIGVYMS